jgi:acetoacetyl-CoA synthetase
LGIRSLGITVNRARVGVESFRADGFETGPAPSMVQISSVSTNIDFLTPIWQRALGLPKIGPDENFFELGGDPAAATRIFQEIAQNGGFELPPFVIYQAPTISSLAALLAPNKPFEFPALVQLKPGSRGLPVFITHGMGGHLFELFSFVRELETQRPIYGLQTRGMDGVSEPFERIEDMAAYFLAAVRKAQPHGPYTLIGYSLGGLVTLEMARRLKKSGETIALLAMLDSYPPIAALSFGQRFRLTSRQAMSRASEKSPDAIARNSAGEGPDVDPSLDFGMSLPAMQRVLAASKRALNSYRPEEYPGRVHFVRAAVPTEFPSDPVPVWKPYLPGLIVETVAGDHHEILAVHHRELASALARYLKETESS